MFNVSMLIIVGAAHFWPREVKLGERGGNFLSRPLFFQFPGRELNSRPSLSNLAMAGVSTIHSTQFNQEQPPTELNQRYATQDMKHLGFSI